MTKDFRNVGRLSTPAPTQTSHEAQQAKQQVLASNQRLILRIINLSAVGFFLAGIWLLTGRPSPIPHDVSFFVGIAFVIAAVSDIVVAQTLKHVWHKKTGG